MTDQLIDGRVIPYPHGRRENDSRLWRDATDLELEQAARIEELEQLIEREWVGLTDEDLNEIDYPELRYIGTGEYVVDGDSVHEFACAIEAKLKEKNT